MVLSSFSSILTAAAVALVSLVAVKQRKAARNHVLFSITPVQREALFRGDFTEIFGEETRQIRKVFDQEGYVILRGLLDNSSMNSLDKAAQVFLKEASAQKASTFSALKFGPVYLSPPKQNKTSSDLEAFRNISLMSTIPSFVATVLLDLPPGKTLRVLKDVFLAKGKEEEYCGWHVDDLTFWPTSAHATSASPGVNAWIAMDDIPSKYGGGLAVARASHKADWRHEAYETIGSTQTFPEEGHKSVKDMMATAKTTTCTLAEAAPELNERIERTSHVSDFKKGDVLIHTRWLFHRSVPLTKAGMRHFQRMGTEPSIKRYSIRYEIGDARLIGGYTLEPSAAMKPENTQRTLDEVCQEDAAWYPKCWPQVDQDEMSRLYEITEERLPAFEPLRQELFREILPYFRKA